MTEIRAEKENKRVLIIGNGFDLAHGLPTSYADFLDFAEAALAIYDYSRYKNLNKPEDFKKYSGKYAEKWEKKKNKFVPNYEKFTNKIWNNLKDLFEKRRENPSTSKKDSPPITVNERLDFFYKQLNNNIWYEYIRELKKQKICGKKWIDFESEVATIIQIIDENHTSLNQSFLELIAFFNSAHNVFINELNQKFNIFYNTYGRLYKNDILDSKSNVARLRKRLYSSLEKFTNAFEIYLTEFVESRIEENAKPLSEIKKIDPEFIINFNYTHTCEKLYNISKDKICYIHGDCNKEKDNSLVLGIGEYFSQDEASEKVDFAIFKKFVQRIRKCNNNISYVKWAEEIEAYRKEHPSNPEDDLSGFDIYVYGHSLDVTDKDILKKFLASEYTSVCIYARNKESEGDLSANLIRIIGEDTMIRKSTNSFSKIKFEITTGK